MFEMFMVFGLKDGLLGFFFLVAEEERLSFRTSSGSLFTTYTSFSTYIY
jgi:hypothetical protein